MNRLLYNVENILHPTEEEKKALLKILHQRTLGKNESFLKEGEVCRTIAFIETGSAVVFYQLDGKKICKDFLFEHDVMGSFASFFSQTPSLLNVAALEKTLILEMEYDEVLTLYDTYPAWQKLGRLIAQEQFIRTEKREASFLKDSPEIRYKKLIEEHPKIFKRVPLKYIASYLGIMPETLSRYRNRFRN